MELTGLTVKTSEQHVDVSEARRKRDWEDFNKFRDCLAERNPFTFTNSNLHSLHAGWTSISGKDHVNCDDAEELGASIHKMLDDNSLATAKIKRKSCFKPLKSLSNVVNVAEEPVYINPSVFFTRLTAVAQREDDIERCFKYEMSPYSPLFKDGLMRKADKASVRKFPMKDDDSIAKEDIPPDATFVIDGGALLHRIRWLHDMTLKDQAKLYVSYTRRHYRRATVVFDGYSAMSTKSDEHARRARTRCHDVDIRESNTCPSSWENFLSNVNDKIQFINLISRFLVDDGQNVINCNGDADTTTVRQAISDSLTSTKTVVVVADDTDIAIMLLYHWKDQTCDIVFYSAQVRKAWSISVVCRNVNSCKDHLLFVHAWSDCDTVSATFGKGIVSFHKLLEKNSELRQISLMMNEISADKAQIGTLSQRPNVPSR